MVRFRLLRGLPLVPLALAFGLLTQDAGFTPSQGTAGTHLAVTGLGFVPVKKPRVDFVVSPPGQAGLKDARAKVLDFSDSGITVETPRLGAGTYAIRVTPRGHEGVPVDLPGTFTAVDPVVDWVEAASVDPGSTFTAHGTFGERKGKMFVGPKKAKVLTWSNATITAVVPKKLPAGPQSVLVRNGSGTSNGSVVLAVGGGGPVPALGITGNPVTVQVPEDCHGTFEIHNTGDPGSTIDYLVADDGALGGFLDVTNASGSLPQGGSVQIQVSVKPEFRDSDPTLAGDTLVLNVYTPGASNFVKFPVTVKVVSAATLAPDAIGTWSGTWSGTTVGPHNPMEAQPVAPVSGSWLLFLDAADPDTGGISGSLFWYGDDAYWIYAYDNGTYSSVTSFPFIPDRTIDFGPSKAFYEASPNGCGLLRIRIEASKDAPNPSDAFYGPDLWMDLDLTHNVVVQQGSTFSTRPYDPNTHETWVSQGSLQGGR